MNDPLTQMLLGAALSLILAECTEVAPWLARRILRLAARMLGNPEASERYEAEWLAILEERPGKLLKLFCASWIALRGTWELRAIHRSSVSTPQSPSQQSAESRAEAPQEPAAPEGQQDHQPRPQTAPRRRGFYINGHYRRPVRLTGRTSRRPRVFFPMVAAILALWVNHLGNTADNPADFTEIAFSLAALALLAWAYCALVMRRVRSRLAAGSFSNEDWALRIRRVPDEAIRTARQAIAVGEEVHIVVSRHDRADTLRVIDIPPLSSLAFVIRPRRRPKR